MAFKLDRKEMLRLARIGAEARLEALEQERQAILRSFPGAQRLNASSNATTDGQPGAQRRRMSPAARRAVSVRMKRYWADRKKRKAG
jgi:hypothetical protein